MVFVGETMQRTSLLALDGGSRGHVPDGRKGRRAHQRRRHFPLSKGRRSGSGYQ